MTKRRKETGSFPPGLQAYAIRAEKAVHEMSNDVDLRKRLGGHFDDAMNQVRRLYAEAFRVEARGKP